MKALVTGGAGFIGSHIADRLLDNGYEVRIVDSLEPRVHPKGKPDYIPEAAEFVVGDVRDKTLMERALNGVDVVFHEAAYQDYMPDFSKFIDVNSVSTALIFEIIVTNGLPVRKVVVASSQAVYGEGRYTCATHGVFDPGPRPDTQLTQAVWDVLCPECAEPAEPLLLEETHFNPNNQYALSKLSQEMIALRLGRLHNVPSTALRYSITQGPRQSLFNAYSGICRIFCMRLLQDLPPIIFEDGEQRRDYVHIADVVDANMTVLDDDRANYQAFNVGSGCATTVREYGSRLAAHLGKKIAPSIPGEYRVGDNRHSVSSIDKLRQLGWEPRRSLDDIFSDYVSWVKSLGSIEDYFSEADRAMRTMNVVRKAESQKDR